MQIICNDGTTIQCNDFEAIDSGVLFFQERTARASEGDAEEGEEEAERKADGFVPITELHFVLPDEMVQQAARQTGVPEQGRAAGTTQGAPTQRGRGLTQQQQTQQQQFPGAPDQPGR